MARFVSRKVVTACGAIAVAVLLSACSGGGGGKPLSVSTDTTSPNDQSPATARTTPSTKHPKAKSTTRSSVPTPTTKSKGTATKPTSGSSATTPPVVFIAPSGGQSPGGSPGASRSTPSTVYRPRPYDPSKPIDLGGYPGVSPAQQARAEKLVRDTLRDLPRYANVSTAYADGFRTIGDAGTGDEHYVKWSLIDDGKVLNPKYPESLVYEFPNGKPTLVAAMYILPFATRYTDIPDVGGALTQWHVHDDLCLAPSPSDPMQKLVRLAQPDGTCAPGQTTAGKAPMLHVWIVANKCGPFAALEGIGAGQTTDGKDRLCDRIHGA